VIIMPKDSEIVHGWRHALRRLVGAPDDLGADPAFYDRLYALCIVRQAVKRRLLPRERAAELLSGDDLTMVCGDVEWQVVVPGDSESRQRLLVIELDGQADGQVAEALGVLAGQE
jgi:hypothetical protein